MSEGWAIREMVIGDFDPALEMWERMPGVGLSAADSAKEIARFLERNPGLCFVAESGGALVGTALCGQDGRRGYLYHVAVDPAHRRTGIGRALVEHCIQALDAQGIDKCHLFVYADNVGAIAFWHAIGWQDRVELKVMSRYTPRGDQA